MYAQKTNPGYIITNNGDTLKGILKIPAAFNDKKIYKITDSTGNKQEIADADMTGYGYVKNGSQKDFVKFIIFRSHFEFLERVVKGKISAYMLYSMGTGTGYNTNVEIYLKDENEKLYIIKEAFGNMGFRKDILKEVLGDCKQVAEKIKGILLEKKVLQLIEEYNTCNEVINN
ncbi:hypothetical protein GCM10027043_45670 [Ferruginibacter profundus]